MPIHQNVAQLKIEIITLVDGFNFVLFLVNLKKEYACSFNCISGKTIKYKQQTAALIAKFQAIQGGSKKYDINDRWVATKSRF